MVAAEMCRREHIRKTVSRRGSMVASNQHEMVDSLMRVRRARAAVPSGFNARCISEGWLETLLRKCLLQRWSRRVFTRQDCCFVDFNSKIERDSIPLFRDRPAILAVQASFGTPSNNLV